MNPELVALALGIARVVAYTGYVLLAGTFAFWSLVWPEGRSDRRLVTLVVAGTALLLASTLAVPAIRMVVGGQLTGDIFSPLGGAAMMVRLAALAATAFFLVDIIRRPVVGWRRALALGVVTVLAATMVVPSDALTGRWAGLKIIATTGHVLATATWLGGLVALAVMLIRRDNLPDLRRLVPRFSVIAAVSVVVLVLTGLVDALAAAGGLAPLADSRYGLVLLVKTVVFAAMIVLAVQGRRYAARIAFRQIHQPTEVLRNSGGMRSLTVLLGAELVLGLVILTASSLLVLVAPH